MKTVKTFSPCEQLVVLVSTNAYDYIRMPKLYEWNNPYITAIRPCYVQKGVYHDLRTGEVVEKMPGMLEWKIFTGTVFGYADGTMLLLSRRFSDGHILLLDIEPKEFKPTTMCLHNVA